MSLTAELLASVVFAAEHRSRRKAKAMLFDLTGNRSATALDAALAEARTGPLREQVAARVAELVEDSERATRANDVWAVQGGALPEWLVAEAADDFRWYIIHFGAHPFIGEVVDLDEVDVPELIAARLDDGQVLACVRWLAETPEPERAAELFAEARRTFRAYEMRAGG